MKNMILKTAFPFFVLAAFSCAGGAANADNAAPEEFQGKNWYLNEVITGTTIFRINRDSKPNLIYTITFDKERFTGVGAPNRYFGSYAANKDHSLLFKKVGSTYMLPMFEINGVKEHEYFAYIKRVTRWEIHEGKLELYSSKENGAQVILVYF